MSTEPRDRAWVEVNPSALQRNLERVRAAVGEEVKLLPLVKGDAYGVGLPSAVRALEAVEPWGYGVATVPEGEAVRALGVMRPVLVMSPVPYRVIPAGVRAGLTLCVSEVEAVRRVAAAAEAQQRETAVHLEVDTGMGRSGFDWRAAPEWGREVRTLTEGGVRWEGLFTHFHSADERDPGTILLQAERFREVRSILEGLGARALTCHLSNSAGALRRPDLVENLVRPGIFLYGGSAGEGLPGPDEVVTVRARVVLVRQVPAGTTLGYGATYRASREERWATVGIGYGDGLPRALGNRGHGLIRGGRVPIIGRISMDLTVVDITDLAGGPVEVGTEVTFLGTDRGDLSGAGVDPGREGAERRTKEGGGISGAERITLEEVAAHAGTISYEILTGLTPRLPRVWPEGGGTGKPEDTDR